MKRFVHYIFILKCADPRSDCVNALFSFMIGIINLLAGIYNVKVVRIVQQPDN